MDMSGRRKEFEGLRFILALCVMLWHSRGYVEQIFPSRIYLFRGEITNVVFYMLSGFFITYNKKVSINNINEYLKFIFKKLKKIYPLYFVSLIYISVLYWGNRFLKANPRLFIRHVLLLQSWPMHNKAAAEFNGPMWFLSCLLFCWMITPIVIKHIKKKWFYFSVMFLTIAFIFESFLPIDCNGIWKLWPTVAYFIGMIIGDIGTEICIEKNKSIYCTLFLVLLFGIAEIACIGQWQYGVLYLTIIIFSLSLIMYILFMSESAIVKILKSNFLSAGGAHSMNMFVIHAPVMYTLDRINDIKDKPWLWLVVFFSTTLLLSVIVNNMRKYIRCKMIGSRGKLL